MQQSKNFWIFSLHYYLPIYINGAIRYYGIINARIMLHFKEKQILNALLEATYISVDRFEILIMEEVFSKGDR
jgi:hypothetical protein